MKPFEQEFLPSELESLDQLAEDLHKAVEPAPLSEDFHDRLEIRLRKSWSFRSALDRNPLMRAAAGLLMISLIAAPVAALVTLFAPPVEAPPVLGFDALPEFSEAERESWQNEGGEGPAAIVGPEDEFDLPVVPMSEERMRALEQRNRLSQAGASLRALEGGQGQSSDEDHMLWSLFLESCVEGPERSLDQGLRDQVSALAQRQDLDASAATALAAWRWVLEGVTTPQAEAPLAWEAAPFLKD